MADYLQTHNDLMTPSTLNAGYIVSHAGADIDKIEAFTEELTEIVEKMKEDLANETRILEGTEVPEYKQNELSEADTKDTQWKNALQNGSWTTDLTLTCEPVSNSLSSSVEHFSPSLDTQLFSGKCPRSQGSSLKEMLVASGYETDAMNESSECTVPMISEQMLGTPNEVK